jgi:hypothetical protein
MVILKEKLGLSAVQCRISNDGAAMGPVAVINIADRTDHSAVIPVEIWKYEAEP